MNAYPAVALMGMGWTGGSERHKVALRPIANDKFPDIMYRVIIYPQGIGSAGVDLAVKGT